MSTAPSLRPALAAPPADGPVLGHVHLKVADLERALGFYRDLLGLEVQQTDGRSVAFLSTGGYHHQVALNTWHSAGGTPPPAGHTGLFHTAFLYRDRPSLARAVQRVRAAGHALHGASDHGVSEAVYLSDPDGNGVELARDRPRDEWPVDAQGRLSMTTRRLDLEALLAEIAA